jgi:hypothetical protein
VCVWLIDEFWIRLDLLTPYTFNSGLQLIQHYHYSLPITVHCWKHTRVLSLHSPLVVSWQRVYNSLSLQITHEVFSQTDSFLAISSQLLCQLQTQETRLNASSSCTRSFLCSLGADPQRMPLASPLLLLQDITVYVLILSLHSSGGFSTFTVVNLSKYKTVSVTPVRPWHF